MKVFLSFLDYFMINFCRISAYLFNEIMKSTVQLTANAARNCGFIARDSHETRANLRMWFEYSLE